MDSAEPCLDAEVWRKCPFSGPAASYPWRGLPTRVWTLGLPIQALPMLFAKNCHLAPTGATQGCCAAHLQEDDPREEALEVDSWPSGRESHSPRDPSVVERAVVVPLAPRTCRWPWQRALQSGPGEVVTSTFLL